MKYLLLVFIISVAVSFSAGGWHSVKNSLSLSENDKVVIDMARTILNKAEEEVSKACGLADQDFEKMTIESVSTQVVNGLNIHV